MLNKKKMEKEIDKWQTKSSPPFFSLAKEINDIKKSLITKINDIQNKKLFNNFLGVKK